MARISDPIPIDSAIDFFCLNDLVDISFIEVINYLKKYHDAKSLVVEYNYIDRDFSNEFSTLYSKTFTANEKYCERIHFFKEDFRDSDDFQSKYNNDKFTYLGFLIKRPIDVGKVGRTIILPMGRDNNCYYLCLINRDVHLLGKTIITKGFPFIEQDSMVITCAQAAMWMVAKYMHFEHCLPRYLPFDITEKATNAFGHAGRRLPSRGLTIDQMNVGLNNMGYFPISECKPLKTDYENDDKYHEEFSRWHPVEKIYPYVESGIPVIICFEKHVCTAIGHKVADKDNEYCNIELIMSKLQQKKEKYAVISSSVFMDAFIIHDDQQGIYRILPTNDRSFGLLNKDNQDYADLLPKKVIDKQGNEVFEYRNIKNDVNAIIIPLPDKIYLLGEDVFTFAKNLLIDDDLVNDLKTINSEYGNKLLRSSKLENGNPIVLRTYFLRSVEFKKLIKNNSDINHKIKRYYLAMDMPRFIWIVEVSIYSIYSNTKAIIGEIVFDSTANKYDINGSYLSIHLPGCFYENDSVYSDAIIDLDIPQESPYKILERNIVHHCNVRRD